MNHLLRYVLLLPFLLLGGALVWADEDDDGEVGDDQDRAQAVIAGDYFGAGDSPGPVQSIKGDAFVAGGEVMLSTPVQGDAVLSGGSVHAGDVVGSDLYSGGGNIVVDAAVGRNARLAGGRIHITRHADIGGNLTIAGSRLLVEGRTGGALAAFGRSVTIDGEIDGGAAVVARSLTVGPNARINGRLTYRSARPPRISPEAIITGGVKQSESEFPEFELVPVLKAAAWVSALMFTAGIFVIGAFVIFLMPDRAKALADQARSHPFGALLLGFALIVCVPVAAVLAMVSVIGFPLGLALIFMWPVIVLLGYLAGMLFVGDALAALLGRSRNGNPSRGLRVVGLAVVLVAAVFVVWVPIFGLLLIMAILFVGTGALALGIREAV